MREWALPLFLIEPLVKSSNLSQILPLKLSLHEQLCVVLPLLPLFLQELFLVHQQLSLAFNLVSNTDSLDYFWCLCALYYVLLCRVEPGLDIVIVKRLLNKTDISALLFFAAAVLVTEHILPDHHAL